jgi:transposase
VASHDLAADKKRAQRLGAALGFLDESGFTQRPPIRATWAPKGRTPVIREPFNWKHLSGIGAVLTTTTGCQPRWFLALHPKAIRGPHVVRFLNALRRHVRRRVILLWDRLPAHRSRLVAHALERHRHWLQIAWLPAYAPEMNPLEYLWNHLDATALANTPPEDLRRLRRQVHNGVQRIRRRPQIGRGFLRHTGLF